MGAGGPLELASHPLAGRAWDPAAGRFLAPDEARARIAAARVLLLGETHDNPEHHRLQADWLRAAAARGKPVVVMEQLDAAGQLAPGWKAGDYQPLLDLARALGLPLRGANFSREQSRELARRGLEALGEDAPRRLALDRTWNEAREAAMRRTLVAGHCGHDSPMIDRMVPVQRARDALLADAIAQAADAGAVAILGRGHARRDLGVPLYLERRGLARGLLSVGLVEVEPDADVPGDYPEAAAARHDLVWFTARARREDPCKGFAPSSPPGKGR